MLDSISFLTRLKTILSHHGLSSAAFADLIRVQRSSISHLLNGRNKPSLEFILKIDKAFTDVDLEWLLYGNGTFPKNEVKNPLLSKVLIKENVTLKKNIERMVIFYTDNTFKTYTEE